MVLSARVALLRVVGQPEKTGLIAIALEPQRAASITNRPAFIALHSHERSLAACRRAGAQGRYLQYLCVATYMPPSEPNADINRTVGRRSLTSARAAARKGARWGVSAGLCLDWGHADRARSAHVLYGSGNPRARCASRLLARVLRQCLPKENYKNREGLVNGRRRRQGARGRGGSPYLENQEGLDGELMRDKASPKFRTGPRPSTIVSFVPAAVYRGPARDNCIACGPRFC